MGTEIKNEQVTNEQQEKGGEAFSLEAAFEALDQVIEKLSDRETPLEETFAAYQTGMELLKKCEAQIDLIEKKVMVLNDEGGMDEL